MESWLKNNPLEHYPTVSTKQFTIGAIIITILGFLAAFSKPFFKTSRNYNFLMTAFAGMIFLNVFFPHLLATLYFGKYTPGVLTALVVNLPLTLYIFFDNIKRNNLALKQTIFLILAGGLVGAPLTFLLLTIGGIYGGFT